MGKQPESRLVRHTLNFLRKKGGHWTKIHGGDNPFQESGIPDILGCYRGWAVAIETKMPGNITSRKQELFLQRWKRAGGFAIVAYNVQDVKRLIAEIDDLEDNE